MTLDNTTGISESSATRCPHLKEVQCDLEIGHIYNVSQHSSLKNEEKTMPDYSQTFGPLGGIRVWPRVLGQLTTCPCSAMRPRPRPRPKLAEARSFGRTDIGGGLSPSSTCPLIGADMPRLKSQYQHQYFCKAYFSIKRLEIWRFNNNWIWRRLLAICWRHRFTW